jgi:hypothetical protein
MGVYIFTKKRGVFFTPLLTPAGDKMTESQPTAKCVVHYLDNENDDTELKFVVAAYRLGIRNDQVPTMIIAFLKSCEKNSEIQECITKKNPELEKEFRELRNRDDSSNT